MFLNKKVVANLSDTESDQIKGGTGDTTCWSDCGCWDKTNGPNCFVSYSCFCGDGTQCAATCCCGPTYAECSNCHC